MNNLKIFAVASAQTDIARWNFTTTVAAPYNTPTPTTNLTSAFLTQLGMTNSYNGGNTANCDVTSTTGDVNALASGFAWRVRGTANNGWANAAPQYTQGMEFDVSTIGFSSIIVSFDVFCTTQGIADMQVQYNTNINNSAGWTNFKGSFAGTTALNGNQTVEHDGAGDTILVMTSNGYNLSSTNNAVTNKIMFDANGSSGANNDPNFGIRLVSCYDINPAVQGSYNSAAGGVYNNTSGNWRFDQIAVQGTAAPELPTGVLFGAAGLGLLFFRARRS